MPIHYSSGGFGDFAGAAGQAADPVAAKLSEIRNFLQRQDIAEEEQARRVTQDAWRRDMEERKFAWEQEQETLYRDERARELDLRQQQQDRLDAQQYSADLDTGVLPISGSSVAILRDRLGKLNPTLAEDFDQDFHTMTGGEYEGAMSPEAYADPRAVRPAYKAVTAYLGMAEDLADAEAREVAPSTILAPIARQFPHFLDSPEGAEFLTEVESVFGADDYNLTRTQAADRARSLRRKGISIARREFQRDSFEKQVLNWSINPDEGMVVPEEEELDALLDDIGTASDPRAAFDKAKRRFSKEHRATELAAREDERRRISRQLAERERALRTQRARAENPSGASMSAAAEAMSAGGVAPEPEPGVSPDGTPVVPEDLQDAFRGPDVEVDGWIAFLKRSGLQGADEATLRKYADKWQSMPPFEEWLERSGLQPMSQFEMDAALTEYNAYVNEQMAALRDGGATPSTPEGMEQWPE